MRQAERNYVSHPLDLVDDSVSVGQVCPIFHAWLSGLSNQSVYLSLDICCATGRGQTEVETLFNQLATTEQLKDSWRDGYKKL